MNMLVSVKLKKFYYLVDFTLQKSENNSGLCSIRVLYFYDLNASELVQLKLHIETSVRESTHTGAQYEAPLPLLEVESNAWIDFRLILKREKLKEMGENSWNTRGLRSHYPSVKY